MVAGFAGPIGAGKSTAARLAADMSNGVVLSFATPLRRELTAVLRCRRGVPRDMPIALFIVVLVLRLAFRLFGYAIDLYKKPTPPLQRWLLQRYGTEYGRKVRGEHYWANLWMEAASRLMSIGVSVFADDVRFQSEVDAIHGLGGRVFVVIGRGANRGTHESELGQFKPDAEIQNKFGHVELREEIRKGIYGTRTN